MGRQSHAKGHAWAMWCVSGTVGLASLALHGILDDLHGDGHANRPPESLPEKLRQAMQYPTHKWHLAGSSSALQIA